MKSSKYNYTVPFGEDVIFYNGITDAFFKVHSSHAPYYEAIISNPNEYKDIYSSFLKKMISAGFILAKDKDEFKNVLKKYKCLRKEDEFHLMILPTYQCNLRCWYCTQNHQDIFMSEETVARSKALILHYINDKLIKTVKLSWFGGEPIVSYDQVLELTNFAKSESIKRDKKFICQITTNATLLTKDKIDALNLAGVTSYQITIDGPQNIHDGIKRLKNASAYEIALKNINYIAHHTHCTLRFNYTEKNLKPDAIISELKERLSNQSLKNIHFLIYKVWQENSAKIDYQKVEKLYAESKSMGMRPKLSIYDMCYADQKNFYCIFPNGKVGKCDNHLPESVQGNLLRNGEIDWKGCIQYQKTPIEDDKSTCRECKYLPICWGPCTSKRKFMIARKGCIECPIENVEDEMRENIIHRYRNTIIEYNFQS